MYKETLESSVSIFDNNVTPLTFVIGSIISIT